MRLIAFHSANPETLRAVKSALNASGAFEWVGQPKGSQWLVGHAGCTPADRRDDVFFVEGAERLADVGIAALRRHVSANTLAALPGDFTFALFDGPEVATFVRSAVGTAPLFVWRGRNALGIASRLTDMTRFMPEEPRLDRLALAVLSRLVCMPPAGRTPLDSVDLLATGHRLTWTRDGLARKPEAWWQPPPRDPASRTRFDDHAAELRALVTGGLERSLDRSGRNLLGLSGGFDSSALAWLSAKTLGIDFSSLSLTPRSRPELADMRDRLGRLHGQLGPRVLQRWEHEISSSARMSLLRNAPSAVWTIAHPVLCLLPRLTAEAPLRCLFGGEGCDEHLGGGPALLDWASSCKASAAFWHHPASLSRGRAVAYWARFRGSMLLRRAPLLTSLSPPSFLSRAMAREYSEYAGDEQAAFTGSTSRRRYLDHRFHHAGAATVQNWEVCSAIGIRRHFPFFNREVIELAYRADPCELTGLEPKRLVRAAFQGEVPAAYLNLPKDRGWEPPGQLSWTDPLPWELGGIVREDWLERAPALMAAQDALRLRVLLNIITAVRNCRSDAKGVR